MKDIVFYFMTHPSISTQLDIQILRSTLKKTVEEYNKDYNIHLIGNFNPNVEKIIFHRSECISCNNSDIKLFYKHFSKRKKEVELNRILRWDNLYRVCKKIKVENFIFSTTTQIPDKKEISRFINSDKIQCKIDFINNKIIEVNTTLMNIGNLQTIFDFTQFILKQYINRNSQLYILSNQLIKEDSYIGISDRFLLGLFYQKNKEKFIEIM